MIVHASISENGNAGWDGKASPGDQTGKEVFKRDWYNGMWNVCLRYTDTKIGMKAAQIAEKLAASNLVGYDQSNRNNLYQTLKGYDFNVERYLKSGVKTECDCSSFIYAIYACLLPHIRSNNNAPVTSNMKERYLYYGFSAFYGSDYLLSPDKLLPGDILVKTGSHTVLVNECLHNPSSGGVDAITCIALDVIKGVYGTGHEQRRDLIYEAVRKRVNELL